MYLIIFLVLIFVIFLRALPEKVYASSSKYEWKKYDRAYDEWVLQITDTELEKRVEEEIKRDWKKPEFKKKINSICLAPFPPLTDDPKYLKRILMAQHGKIPRADTRGVYVEFYQGYPVGERKKDWRIGCSDFMRWWVYELNEHGREEEIYFTAKFGEVRDVPLTPREVIRYELGDGEFTFSHAMSPWHWDRRKNWLENRGKVYW